MPNFLLRYKQRIYDLNYFTILYRRLEGWKDGTRRELGG